MQPAADSVIDKEADRRGRRVASLFALLALLSALATAIDSKQAQAAPLVGAAEAAPTAQQSLIYFDNDFLGPGQTNIQALIPLLARPDVKVVGIGVVTGDAWLKEETQHVLRFLEIAGRGDIPVLMGAQTPLIRTPVEMRNWEAQYGAIPWKGAWNAPRPGRTFHPETPDFVPPMPEGAPTLKPSSEDAAHFLIRMVHEHPGEITIVAAGPLTNIALAVRLSPDLPSLAKEIIFEGGKVDTLVSQVTENANYATDFNLLFDPEAAHIVLTAPWKRITAVGNATLGLLVTPEIAERIGAAGTPVALYFKEYAKRGQPFWDEATTAVALDRTLISREIVARMDVDLQAGLHYGQARIWNDAYAPTSGLQPVHLVLAIDSQRFLESYLAAASK